MTIGDNNTISATDLNTDLDASRGTIDTVRRATVGLRVRVQKENLQSGDAAVTRQTVFTPQDNYELVSLWIRGDNAAGADQWTLTLSVASGETEYLLDDTVSVNIPSASGGTDQVTGNYAATSATRYVLRKGVAYALTLESDDTNTNDLVQGIATFKLKRRES